MKKFKMRVKSCIKKRFIRLQEGKIKYRSPNKKHLNIKKTRERKNRLKKNKVVYFKWFLHSNKILV